MESDLAGQAVLVTGASGGIGRAVARALAAEGARVALHYFTSEAAVAALAGELGGGALPLAADLRHEAEVEGLFAGALAACGRLDAVVVNAGIWVEEPVPLHRMSLAQWEATQAADLTSAFLTCRAFLRHLASAPRERASIVLVGSTAALFGEEGHADYSAAKAAMAYGLTLSLKNEIVRLAPRGRVNCVCPGWVETPMSEEVLIDPAAVARLTATMALRKVATPEEVAAAIVFLTSDRLAGHLSGTILPVAGGMEGRLLHL
jgi:3-oxoacyl-[acyl-carrier protein] reductase